MISFETLAPGQQDELVLKALQKRNSAALVFEEASLPLTPSSIIFDTSAGTPRPFVPEHLRMSVL